MLSRSKLAESTTAALKRREKDREEQEAKARKAELDQLHKKVVKESLPAEVCEREICTTWVSPAVKSLVPAAKDRYVLQKASAENFRLKMETKSIPVRPLSMPSLRTKDGGTRRRAPDAMTISAKDDS